MKGATAEARTFPAEGAVGAGYAASRADGVAARGRPRVLHLITSFEMGGTERQAVTLLKRLDPARFDVRLAVLRHEGSFYQEIAARFPDVPEFRLTSFYNRNALRQLARFRAFLMSERIDLLHAHDFYASLFGAAAARLAGVRVIASQRHMRLSDRRVHKWGHLLIYRLANRILVNSQAIRALILEEGSAPPEKIVVIRNGLYSTGDETITGPEAIPDPAEGRRLREELCRELGLNADVKIVGIGSRLQPSKGHRYFIDAAARLAREVANVHFVVIGIGPLRGEIESQARRLGIADRMHLLGGRPGANRLVAAFDVAVLASLHEGLPNIVMEAMAARVPVVATAVCGALELITDGETGYLVPPADATALAERIKAVLTDERRSREIGMQGREYVLSQFGIERMVGSVERLYDEMMAT